MACRGTGRCLPPYHSEGQSHGPGVVDDVSPHLRLQEGALGQAPVLVGGDLWGPKRKKEMGTSVPHFRPLSLRFLCLQRAILKAERLTYKSLVQFSQGKMGISGRFGGCTLQKDPRTKPNVTISLVPMPLCSVSGAKKQEGPVLASSTSSMIKGDE